MAENRTQIISSTLCKHLSLNPNDFVGEVEKGDVKSLCTEILKLSPKGSSLLSNDEAMKWIAFADSFPLNSEECLSSLNGLNDVLAHKSVLLGNGFKISEVDVIVYSAIHSCLVAMSDSAKKNFTHVLRWADYVQNKVDLGSFLEKIPVEKIRFEPPAPKSASNVEANLNPRDVSKDVKADSNTKKDTGKGSNGVGVPATDTTVKKAKNDKKATGSEQKKPEPVAASKDDVPVSLLNIQVGLIRKAQKHPSADSLLVEEIDVGESKVRQVVSGLAKFCNPDDLVNRRVVLITNVKPGKLRDIVSEGLVLCASNEDHSVVEPLLPPESAQIGERVSFSGHDGKPEDVLNPKKKQFDKITPHFFTDDNGMATYKGIPFMTSAGPCTSSIRKGSIK